jgi:hypothetical protein
MFRLVPQERHLLSFFLAAVAGICGDWCSIFPDYISIGRGDEGAIRVFTAYCPRY